MSIEQPEPILICMAIFVIVMVHVVLFLALRDRLDRRRDVAVFHRELEDLAIEPDVVERLVNLTEDPKGLLIRLPLQQTPFPARSYAENRKVQASVNETLFDLARAIGKQRISLMYENRGR